MQPLALPQSCGSKVLPPCRWTNKKITVVPFFKQWWQICLNLLSGSVLCQQYKQELVRKLIAVRDVRSTKLSCFAECIHFMTSFDKTRGPKGPPDPREEGHLLPAAEGFQNPDRFPTLGQRSKISNVSSAGAEAVGTSELCAVWEHCESQCTLTLSQTPCSKNCTGIIVSLNKELVATQLMPNCFCHHI